MQFNSLNTSDEELRAIFESIDQDGTGAIKYTEFVAATMTERAYSSTKQMEAAFRRIDVDNSGGIDVDELTSILGQAYGSSGAADALAKADQNGDGVVDLEEFISAVSGVPLNPYVELEC